MGPLSARSYPGQPVGRACPVASEQPAARAKQEGDDGRGGKGDFFGAFRPAPGQALRHPYDARTIANWVDFLEKTDAWLPSEADGVKQVYAILDNLNVHRGTDVLLFSLAHPRWEFVFTPTYAAYLNRIEPWWKVLGSLALQGRRFESGEEVVAAVEKATCYWNRHSHPFRWGQRRRHRPKRKPGLAAVPRAA